MSPTAEVLETRLGFPQPSDGHPVLVNHTTQSAIAINGWKSILFGTPFLVAGFFIVLAAFNSANPRKNAPDWLIGIIGAMFFLPGAFLIIHGFHDLVRKALWKRAAAANPGEPWVYDFHWHREGIAFSAFDDMLKRLLAALAWNAFLVPFAWIGTQRGVWPFLIASVIFALLGLIFWYRWAAMLLDLLRYGNSYLSYESFPFALGGTLRARLRAPRHISAIDQLTATLRCVQEQYVTSGTGQNRSTSVVCYELYKDVLTLDRDRLTGLAGNDIPFEFRVPPDQATTTLASTPPIYWEIELKGNAHSINYEAYFLVPVYRVA